jgi:hypothetical protein
LTISNVGNEKNLFTNKTISKNLSKNYFCVIKELKTAVVKGYTKSKHSNKFAIPKCWQSL